MVDQQTYEVLDAIYTLALFSDDDININLGLEELFVDAAAL